MITFKTFCHHSKYYKRKCISGTIKNVYFKRISHPVVKQKLLAGSRLHSLLKSLQNDPRIDEQTII